MYTLVGLYILKVNETHHWKLYSQLSLVYSKKNMPNILHKDDCFLMCCLAVTVVLRWRTTAKAANEWTVWLCFMNYDLQSLPNGAAWKIFALLCKLKAGKMLNMEKLRHLRRENVCRVFSCPVLLSVCVKWKSQRAFLGWQQRWPSLAPCCCGQWLDHLIMMFVLMSSCTDVPERKKNNDLASVFILSALYLFDKCFVAEWRWYRETSQFLRGATVWNQTIYYCWTLYTVGLEGSRGETEKSNADKNIEKKQCCEPIYVTFGLNIYLYNMQMSLEWCIDV